MRVRILDLDGSLGVQKDLQRRYRPAVLPLTGWGPKIRLGCAFGRFRRFEADLAGLANAADTDEPAVTFCGSGDFHHVSLALVRRMTTPCNLLVIDNHPDWMRGVPFLHCGTWVYHAARLPHVRRVFHVGGDVDFDNYYRWMAPWPLLRQGKIVTIPGVRRFTRGPWSGIPNEPVRPAPDQPAPRDRLEELVRPFAADLGKYPLYVSLDKDVMVERESVVNWDSGHLTLKEVCGILEVFLRAAWGKLAGMDVVGDWSPVWLRGLLRRFLHWTEHPTLNVDAAAAARRNVKTNLVVLETVRAHCGPGAKVA